MDTDTIVKLAMWVVAAAGIVAWITAVVWTKKLPKVFEPDLPTESEEK